MCKVYALDVKYRLCVDCRLTNRPNIWYFTHSHHHTAHSTRRNKCVFTVSSNTKLVTHTLAYLVLAVTLALNTRGGDSSDYS